MDKTPPWKQSWLKLLQPPFLRTSVSPFKLAARPKYFKNLYPSSKFMSVEKCSRPVTCPVGHCCQSELHLSHMAASVKDVSVQDNSFALWSASSRAMSRCRHLAWIASLTCCTADVICHFRVWTNPRFSTIADRGDTDPGNAFKLAPFVAPDRVPTCHFCAAPTMPLLTRNTIELLRFPIAIFQFSGFWGLLGHRSH